MQIFLDIGNSTIFCRNLAITSLNASEVHNCSCPTLTLTIVALPSLHLRKTQSVKSMQDLLHPSIQSAPSTQSTASSLAYSLDSDVLLNSVANSPAVPTSVDASGGNPHPYATNDDDSDTGSSTTNSNMPPPPAYEFQRSERISEPNNDNARSGSFATTEDSIDASLCSEVSGSGYSERNDRDYVGSTAYSQLEGEYNYNSYQEQMSGTNYGNTVNESAGLQGYSSGSGVFGSDDATTTVHQMHKSLLQLLSSPELFHEALNWQDLMDRGEDPITSVVDSKKERGGDSRNSTFDTEFDDASQGVGVGSGEQKQIDHEEDDNTPVVSHSANEDFSNQATTVNRGDDKGKGTTRKAHERKPQIPLPHQIFAQDAEVVLPQALTASQLFGIERVTGIELEAAAGIEGLSHLFLRWLGTCTCCHTSSCTVIALTLRTFHYNSILQHNSTHARRRSHEHH